LWSGFSTRCCRATTINTDNKCVHARKSFVDFKPVFVKDRQHCCGKRIRGDVNSASVAGEQAHAPSVNRSWLRRPNPHAASQSSDRRLTAGGLRTLWPAHPVVGHPIGRHDRLNALRNGLPRRRTWARAKESVQPNVSAATGVESVNPASTAKKKVRDISEAFPSSSTPPDQRAHQATGCWKLSVQGARPAAKPRDPARMKRGR
jgi:hypothetical protein